MVTQKQGRVAAGAAAAMFVVVAGVQFYGVIDEAVGADPPPVRELIGAALMGLLALAAAVILLVRVGYSPAHVSFEVGRTYAPWVAWLGLGGAVAGFAGQMNAAWYIAGPINLVLALLAFVVARSELPGSPTSGAAPTPSGTSGHPTSAH
jgi:hypothetical protein